MPWTFLRPADPGVLAGRPLLDLGTGDGKTREALAPSGFVVAVDRRLELLRPGDVGADASRLPFRDSSFRVVLAADLFHHFDDTELAKALAEVRRVLAPDGRLVAWWYERTADPSPDAPRHPRGYEAFVATARGAALEAETLDVVSAVEGSPTVAVVATATS